GYLERLRDRGVEHVWVEKILEPGERLRDWPVEGTTGYEFANDVTALFVDPAGEAPLTELYADLTGERRRFAEIAHEAKLEQATTGPVMAKGVEDTAFYRYVRLTALNEVGGNPDRFSLPVDDFHRTNLERAARFPRQLLTTQTHDTKRSGDVRARIGVLSELP